MLINFFILSQADMEPVIADDSRECLTFNIYLIIEKKVKEMQLNRYDK